MYGTNEGWKSRGLSSVWGLIVLLWMAGSGAVLAQENADCLMCHEDPELTTTLPDGTVIPLYVDEELFKTSIHGDMQCVECHSDIESLPHESLPKPVDCGNCHEETEAYSKSLHGLALKGGDKGAATCGSCHGTHNIRAVDDPLSSTNHRNLPATCGKCHSDRALVKSHMISVADPSDKYMKSVHGRANAADPNSKAATCSDCHGSHDLLPSQDAGSSIHRMNIPKTCGKCHEDKQKEYDAGIHGKALYAGIKDAPTCVDCHGEHEIKPPEEASSPINLQQVARTTCPRCHDNERIMTRYGIETMRQASYMDSYHGLAGAAGSRVVASCTSCHGAHKILSHLDPESSTHVDNLPETCGQCHDNANPNFAIGAVHIMPTDPSQKALGIVRLIYILLIAGVVGGMVFHNTLMMGRHALTKFKQELGGKGTYRRFPTGLTVGHMILTIAFIALVVSGFALRYPTTWWAQIIFPGEAGLAARGMVHRIAAVVLCVLSIVNAAYLIFTKGGRKELGSLMFKLKDLGDVFRNMGYVIGIVKQQPLFDRYSYIEKFEYWGMWWGTVLMIITGFCMWFANTFLDFLPKIWLDVIALIHFYEAWLAFLTITIWHLYYMIFDPHTYPMNWSWITGHITEEDFKERHPLEYERVMRERQAAKEADVK